MKQQSKLLLSLLHGAGVGAVVLSGGSLFSTDASAGISNTRHNLGASGTIVGANRVTDTGEVCVFCHTPHAAATGTNVPPLWNKNLITTATYTTYATSAGSSSLDSSNNNGSVATGSISLACLSCHDGTQAMDNIINAPGSAGVTAGGGTGGLAYTWSGTGANSSGVMINTATTLGADLRNDHPIGIAYCGGNTGAYPAAGTTGCRDGDFKALALAGGAAGTSTAQYYIDAGGTAGSRDKSDIMLYTRDFGGTNQYKPSVECGSCHDPHVEAKATNQVAFLRISQTASGLCLACHNK